MVFLVTAVFKAEQLSARLQGCSLLFCPWIMSLQCSLFSYGLFMTEILVNVNPEYFIWGSFSL